MQLKVLTGKRVRQQRRNDQGNRRPHKCHQHGDPVGFKNRSCPCDDISVGIQAEYPGPELVAVSDQRAFLRHGRHDQQHKRQQAAQGQKNQDDIDHDLKCSFTF